MLLLKMVSQTSGLLACLRLSRIYEEPLNTTSAQPVLGMVDNNQQVRITYETLYEVCRREKNRDEMQALPDKFLEDVVAYLRQKEQILADSRKRFDLFSAAERDKTEIQVRNIRKLLKELYERRESKILTMALNKSRTNTTLVDLSALLVEERVLFDALVTSLNNGREGIVHQLLQGRHPDVSMHVESDSPRHEQAPLAQPQEYEEPEPSDELTSEISPALENAQMQEQNHPASSKSVKIIDDVPKFVGAELEEYGPFLKDETHLLPEEIAEVLIAAGKAVGSQ